VKALIALLVLLLAAPASARAQEAEPFGAEDGGAEAHAPIIPEPMVFDLVRPLGAKKGELEGNALVEIPLEKRDPGDPSVYWAPEIEAAPFDGFALELEIPFEDGTVEAYKFAAQYTFGTAASNRYIHGTQAIAERLRDSGSWELTILYLAGYRFDRTWSVLGMIGGRTLQGGDLPSGSEALLNASVFADVAHSASLGLETNVATDFDDHAVFLVIPQIHYEITDRVMIQAGAGAEIEDGDATPTLAFRLIFAR
jgi:hypothetical protein